jgi:tRNA pseudouridine55 synthase
VPPTGLVRQRPPAYSAVKIGGERAYARARRGEAVETAEREVQVSRFELLWRDGDRAAFSIECSSGTYVRSLVADLGDAYCLELRRTAIGPFEVADADEERVVELAAALAFLPEVVLGADDARRAGHGVAVAVPSPPAAGTVRLADAEGLIALAEPRPDGTLKPVVGFRG